jgi:hypothetical protein
MIGKRGDARTFSELGRFWGETMRLLIAGLALVIAVVAVTATAQAQQASQMNAASNVGRHAAAADTRSATNEANAKANDKAYNAALKNLPDKQYDPWRGVR